MDEVALKQVLSSFFSLTLLITYKYLSPYDSPDQAAHYHPSPLISELHLDGYRVGNCLRYYADQFPVGLGMEARTSDCSSAAKSRSRYFHARNFPHSIIIRRAMVHVYILSS